MDEENWWNERLEAWSHEGFDTGPIRIILEENPDTASELMIDYENLVKINRALRKRIIESSLSHEKKSEWLTRLDDFSSTERTLLEWESDSRENRPWEPYVNRAEKKWIDLGVRNDLTKIVKRLEMLDESSYPACQPLYILFDNVGNLEVIQTMLTEIENDENKRRDIIVEMISLLQEEGVDASAARIMNISDALDYINSMQGVAKEMRSTRLRIDKEIRPFDEELADRLIAKRNEGLDDEVSAIVENLGTRLTNLNSKIKKWENDGIQISDKSKISAEELLEWEANLPDLEKMIETHMAAAERWNHFRKVWPEKVSHIEFIGQLEKTDELLDIVDSLEAEWRTFELEGMEIISKWEDFGFVMDLWRQRISDEPRSGLAWLKIEDENYSMAKDLIDALMRLDASISGEDEILRRATILREFELETSLLEEMSDFIEKHARRAARHRSMLEIEWLDIVRTKGVRDKPTANLSLSEFEKLISDANTGKGGFSLPIDRLEENLRNEIERWHQLGYNVDSLRDGLSIDAVDMALKISSIREAVKNHDQLIRRLENLDWRRDPKLSVAINNQLSQPDKLPLLAANIPKIAVELARKDVEDEHFRFIPWRPHRRSRKVLVPVAKSAADDAMEAILEEMEGNIAEEIENLEGVFDDSEGDDENEEPEKKPGRIRGLVSGGGRDGVGKFGALGDMVGGITDRLGVTDYGLAGASAKRKKEHQDSTEIEDSEIDSDEPEEEDYDESEEMDAHEEEYEEPHGIVIPKDEGPEFTVTKQVIPQGHIEASENLHNISKLMRALGLESEASKFEEDNDMNAVRRILASHVGTEPRDMRLDRLLRLTLRLIPNGENDDAKLALIAKLSELATELSKWTRIRLEARHSGPTGYLLDDAKTLGVALDRIPGPGTPLPLVADEHELPNPSDLEGLSNEVRLLSKRVILSTSGGVR
ncbi:MAG: hypothetical protein ACPHDO_00255 [Candidatus Poseidoniaceae archaeon]